LDNLPPALAVFLTDAGIASKKRLRIHLKQHDGKSDLLFVNRRGRPFSANKLREKQLHPLLVKLGIPRGGFHSMRHGAASALLADGATPAVVQKQLRHSDPRTTLGIYGHVVGNEQRDAVENRCNTHRSVRSELVQLVKQMRADARCRVATPESIALPDSSALSGHVHGRTLLSAGPYELYGVPIHLPLQLVPNALLVPTALIRHWESRSLVGAVGIEPTFEPWEARNPTSLFFSRGLWVLRHSPFSWSIHTPQFRSRIDWPDSSRIIGLSFASSRHLC
jgi:hypothetical protein